jgi:hypothetical protein
LFGEINPASRARLFLKPEKMAGRLPDFLTAQIDGRFLKYHNSFFTFVCSQKHPTDNDFQRTDQGPQ